MFDKCGCIVGWRTDVDGERGDEIECNKPATCYPSEYGSTATMCHACAVDVQSVEGGDIVFLTVHSVVGSLDAAGDVR